MLIYLKYIYLFLKAIKKERIIVNSKRRKIEKNVIEKHVKRALNLSHHSTKSHALYEWSIIDISALSIIPSLCNLIDGCSRAALTKTFPFPSSVSSAFLSFAFVRWSFSFSIQGQEKE